MADLNSYLAKGQPSSYISDLDPQFSQSMASLLDAVPPNLRGQIIIYSGARSPERQAQLYKAAIAKYGSEQAARKWVAPPGKSKHNLGIANDLRFGSDEARKWAHDNAGQFGLTFPMAHEPWHIEPIGARSHNHQAMAQPVAAPPEPVLGADRRQAAVQEQIAAPPVAQPDMPMAGQQSPLGNMLSGFMQGFAPQNAGPTVKQDDSPQVAANAAGLAEKGRQLKSAFLPNIENILSMGKRPTVV